MKMQQSRAAHTRPKTKRNHTNHTIVQGLLEIISAATEYDALPVRPGEEEAVRRLLAHSQVRSGVQIPHITRGAGGGGCWLALYCILC